MVVYGQQYSSDEAINNDSRVYVSLVVVYYDILINNLKL